MDDILKDPMFFYGIAFLIFIGLAVAKGRKPLLGWLDGEVRKISDELERARQLRTEAESLLADYTVRQAAALTEADAILAHVRAEAERFKAQAESAFAHRLKIHEQHAAERIRQAEAEAIAQVRSVTITQAVDCARETFTKRLNAAKQSALIDQAVQNISA